MITILILQGIIRMVLLVIIKMLMEDNVLGPDGSFVQVKGPVMQFKEAWSVGFAYKF